MLTRTLVEDLFSNAVLLVVGVGVLCLRDFCKRVAHSDCVYDANAGGLRIKLPTWREPDNAVELS